MCLTQLLLPVLLMASTDLPGADQYLAGRAAERDAKYGEAFASYEVCRQQEGPLQAYAGVRATYCQAQGGSLEEALESYKILLGHEQGAWMRLARVEFAGFLEKQARFAEAIEQYDLALTLPFAPRWLARYQWQQANLLVNNPPTASRGFAFFRGAMDAARLGSERLDAARRLALSPTVEDRFGALCGMLQSNALDEAGKTAVSLVPDLPTSSSLQSELRFVNAFMLMMSGNAAEGQAALYAALETKQQSRLAVLGLAYLVRARIKDADYDSAKSALDLMVESFPDAKETGDALYRIARALEEEDRSDNAVAAYSRIIDKCPAHTRAGDALLAGGRLLEAAGNSDAAIAWYRKARTLPSAGRRASASLFRGAELLLKAGRSQEAVEEFQAAAHLPLGDYFVHRAAQRLVDLKVDETAVSNSAMLDGAASLIRPIAISTESKAPETAALEHDERFERLRFFGGNGLPEAEWEALDLIQGVANDAATLSLLTSLAQCGLAHTANEVMDTLSRGSSDNGPTIERLRIQFPLAYWDIVKDLGTKADVDPYLLLAVARQESTFRAAIESHAGAVGVMQLMPSTAQWLAKVDPNVPTDDAQKLENPNASLRLGARYLSRLKERFDGNLVLTLSAYNAGPGNVNKWTKNGVAQDMDAFIESIPFQETRDYVQRVLGNYAAYHSLYDTPERKENT